MRAISDFVFTTKGITPAELDQRRDATCVICSNVWPVFYLKMTDDGHFGMSDIDRSFSHAAKTAVEGSADNNWQRLLEANLDTFKQMVSKKSGVREFDFNGNQLVVGAGFLYARKKNGENFFYTDEFFSDDGRIKASASLYILDALGAFSEYRAPIFFWYKKVVQAITSG